MVRHMPTRTVYVVFKAKAGVKPFPSKLCLSPLQPL